MKVGWIGLGAMGMPMARALARSGHEVRVYDVNPGVVEVATGAGLSARDRPDSVADGVEALFVMVATPAQLEDVLFGPSGVASKLDPSAVVVVMATVGPSAIEGAADRLAELGLTNLVDAPVSGGVVRAESGELTVMLSGPEAAVAAVAPLIGAMAGHVARFGDRPGDGQRAKLVNQLLCGVHIAVAAEALAFAADLGLDVEQCWETVRSGAAASFMLDDRGSRMVHPSDEVRSAVALFAKDMALVVDTASDLAADTPLATAARALFERAAAQGLARRDDSSVIELWR